MNLTHALFAALGVAMALNPSTSMGAPEARAPMRDVAKHDDLSMKLRMAQQKDPINNMGPAIGNLEEDPSIPQTKRSFIDSSTILCFRGLITFVPKRAVLHVPKHLESRLKIQGKIQVKNWQEFYLANRGWIRTIEVTRDQALGNTPFSEAAIAAMSESSSLIVATFKEGPIAVRPPQKKDAGEELATNSDPSEK